LPAEVAGTAGAGDAFAATFAAYIAMGRSPEDAARAGAVNAASVVTRVDAEGGLLDAAELETRCGAHAADLPITTWVLG
jgi:sugar/nucleoside kinase (ribokinase family)